MNNRDALMKKKNINNYQSSITTRKKKKFSMLVLKMESKICKLDVLLKKTCKNLKMFRLNIQINRGKICLKLILNLLLIIMRIIFDEF